MERSFIRDAHVILEACPPVLADQRKSYAILQHSFGLYNNFQGISVPDLQDSGEFKRHRDRVPNEEFAAWLQEMTSKPLCLYKVAAGCPQPEFEGWLKRASSLGCREVFLVGADTSDAKSTPDSLTIRTASDVARAAGFVCGGIIIPTRREHFVQRPATVDETSRVIQKITEYHLEFFSTQILYESEWMCCLLLDLVRILDQKDLPKIFLTFSPFVAAEEITFAKKTLGVFVPKDVERMLKGARSMREASITHLIGVWDRLSSFASQIGYPEERLGVNVEYLDTRNPRAIDASFELAEEFGRLLDRRARRSAKQTQNTTSS